MPSLAPWVLVTYGATLAVTGSRLARPLRALAARWSPALGRFVSCPMCVGWWVGLAEAIVLPGVCPVDGVAAWVRLPANAFAGLAAAWVCHVVLAWLGADRL